MKKTYKNPSYKIIAINSSDMMAQSPLGFDMEYVDTNAENQFVKENVTKQGGSLWDEEW